MPVRANAGMNRQGRNTIRVPGAYRLALESKCERDALRAAPDYLALADDDEVGPTRWVTLGSLLLTTDLVADQGRPAGAGRT